MGQSTSNDSPQSNDKALPDAPRPREIEDQYLTASVSGAWVKEWQDYANTLHRLYMGALGRSEAKSEEIAQLRHDLSRAMENHNADLNSAECSAVAELTDAEILKVYKEEYFAVENGNLRHGDSDLAVIAAVRRVVAARSATTASKWIPISERKPETRIRVLTSNELIVEVMYIDWDGKWHFENGQRVVMEHHFPTHWQPLPERVGKGSIGVSGVAVAPFERLIEKSMAESPVFLPLAIQLLNSVKAWRDCDGNDGFPQEVREQIDALLTAYELREQEKRTLG